MFWSQLYQAEIVTRDAQFAVDNDDVSGITLWQFSDIKADDDSTRSCGQCKYLPHSQSLSVPWDCGYIDVSCGRPGGENHKGIVDFWRRQKMDFPLVAGIYAGAKEKNEKNQEL